MLDTVAYAKNVYAGSPAWFGTLEGGGIPGNLSYDQFNAAARGFPTMGDGPIGTAVGSSVTVGGADLTPRTGSAAIDAGARPFVPWALKRTVGEWNFRRGAPGLDEHWYMSPSVIDRNNYWKLPRNDLQMPGRARPAAAASEDWIDSAVVFGGAPARLPAPEGLLPEPPRETSGSDRVTLSLGTWAEMDAPACPKLGARESFRVTLKNVPSSWIGHQLCVDVHWHNAAGGGGWLTGSYPRQTITVASEGNVITIYYTLPLTITAKTDSKTDFWEGERNGKPVEGEVTFLKFRNAFEVAEGDGTLVVDVSADERFYLTLDGRFLARGPNRATVENWQYQTYVVTGLAPGRHVVEAVVWTLGDFGPLAQLSHRGGFVLKAGGAYDAKLTTGKGAWQVGRLAGIRPIGKDKDAGAWGTGSQFEIVGAGPYAGEPAAWRTPEVGRGGAGHAGPMNWGGRTGGWMLFPAQLPDQIEKRIAPGRFRAASTEPPEQGEGEALLGEGPGRRKVKVTVDKPYIYKNQSILNLL